MPGPSAGGTTIPQTAPRAVRDRPEASVGMRLSFVPLVVALLPLAAIHLCYLLAAHLGHVPWCLHAWHRANEVSQRLETAGPGPVSPLTAIYATTVRYEEG